MLQTRVVTCETCGNHVHEECFKAWATQKRSSHQSVTCVYCRSAWSDPVTAAADASAEGYINLKNLSAVRSSKPLSFPNSSVDLKRKTP